MVESEPTKSGPAKNGLPLTVGATGAESADTVATRAVRAKAVVEYFIASELVCK